VDCPVDATTLQMADRQGIEIDYCPSCRGVWLDRGELDKLIERSQEFDAAPASRRQPDRYSSEPRWGDDERRHRDYDDDDDDDDRRHGSKYGRRHKRKNMLEDLFDFG
jgi:Zn-finger nucleic acid-binding protein